MMWRLVRALSPIVSFVHRAPGVVRRAVGVALFDRRQGVETWRPVDLAALGLAREHRVEYTPSGWFDLRRALSGRAIGPDDVFLDLGSGKGRIVLQAARLPFKRVIGVELSAELNAVAAANVAAARSSLRCKDVELVTADVAGFRIPDDVTIAYTYNAFTGPVFQRVIEELIASVERRPRTVRLLYRTPREHERLAQTGWFRLVRHYGILVDANQLDRGKLAAGFRLEDLDVADVARPQPGSSDGRAEACIWIGNTGTLRRSRVRSCGWTGLWTGTAARGASVDQLDVDRTRTGVYLEHYTTDSTFRRLRVGPRVRIGLVAEWASPAWDGKPASVGNVIERSHFETSLAGVYLDDGTTRTTIRRSSFAGQRWAAIGDYRGVGNTYSANDYRGIAAGAAQVSKQHPTEFRP